MIFNVLISISNPKISWLIISVLSLILILFFFIYFLFLKNNFFIRFILAKDISSACSGIGIFGAIIGLFGLYNSYWIGLLWALINYILMVLLSKGYNPSIGRLY